MVHAFPTGHHPCPTQQWHSQDDPLVNEDMQGLLANTRQRLEPSGRRQRGDACRGSEQLPPRPFQTTTPAKSNPGELGGRG